MQDKDPAVHRPAEPEASGRSAHCQGHEGLPKTQVRQRLTAADKLVSVGSLKTLCKLSFDFYSTSGSRCSVLYKRSEIMTVDREHCNGHVDSFTEGVVEKFLTHERRKMQTFDLYQISFCCS